MGENPLKGYYLTRVYKGDDPFMTVMDLIREEAVAVCERAVPHRRAGEQLGLEPYLDKREEVESWVRENAKAVGVDIKKENPIYFALTKGLRPGTPGHFISIPADTMDLSNCSFTYDDSFINFSFFENHTGNIPEHPMHGIVLNAKQMAAAVQKYGVLDNYDKGQRYVEVQMWGRPAMNDLPQQAKPQLPKSQRKP